MLFKVFRFFQKEPKLKIGILWGYTQKREGEKNASYFSVITQKCKMFKGYFRGGYCFFFKTIKYVLCLQHTGTTFKKQKNIYF
jgi:hypothetical protein